MQTRIARLKFASIDLTEKFHKIQLIGFHELLPIHFSPILEDLNIFVNLKIESIFGIEKKRQSFMVQSELEVYWVDKRLKFKDLNANDQLNALSREEKQMLWIPSFKIKNSTDNFLVFLNDENTTGYIKLKPNAFERAEFGPLQKVQNYQSFKGTDG